MPIYNVKSIIDLFSAKRVFLIILLLFIAIRAFSLMSFPIFNDEAIYLQYSQIIHSNFVKYANISMKNIYNDWKPPLQYWLGSVFIDLFDDPLLSGRIVALVFSILGLLGIYLLALRLYGGKVALWASFFYAISPSVLMYNNQFVAETFVFSTAPLFYFFCLRMVQSEKIRWFDAASTIALSAMLLLFKQSGALLLILAVFMPFVIFKKINEQQSQRNQEIAKKINKNKFFSKIIAVVLVIAFSYLLYFLIIPHSGTNVNKDFTDNWVMSISEFFKLPFGIWANNFNLISNYYLHYYGIVVALIVLLFIVWSFVKGNIEDKVISVMFVLASAFVFFILKKFNEYIYNTAVIIFVIVILGRAVSYLLDKFKSLIALKSKEFYFSLVFLLFFIFAIGNWVYQDYLITKSPIKYIERSSPWMTNNYLIGWASGFGVNKVVDFLKKQTVPGVVFADTQWGNPRTSLEVYHSFYPNTTVLPANIYGIEDALKNEQLKNRFFIFSASDIGKTKEEIEVFSNLCKQKQEVKVYDKQVPIIICRF